MSENNKAADAIVLDQSLTGRQKIRAMLMARGLSVAAWAAKRGIDHEERVHMMLGGRRPYPEIRDMLAADLGLTREQFDSIIPVPEQSV